MIVARRPIHPGEILADELAETGWSVEGLADALAVPPGGVDAILSGRRDITADTALRLGRYLGMSAEFWMNLQRSYEMDSVRQRTTD